MIYYNAAVQLLFPPSETFVSENHQGSQMQDESAQLASISEKWQDEAALAWAYCTQDCSSDHKQKHLPELFGDGLVGWAMQG